jgi:hypothetical protein
MPNSKHLTYGIINLVSLITKTKLGLSLEQVRTDELKKSWYVHGLDNKFVKMLSTIPEATFHETVNATITFEGADHPNTKAKKRKIAPTGFSGGSNQHWRF